MSAATSQRGYSVTDAQVTGGSKADTSPPSLRPATENATRVVYPAPRMHVRWAISAGGREYALRHTFVLDVEALPEGGYFASHSKLPVSGWGENPRMAIDELCEAFDVQYRALVDVPPEAISPGALVHRAAFEALVASVMPAVQR